MKILLINVVYEKGSTGNITKTLCDYFVKNNHNCDVIYGCGKKRDTQNLHKPTIELERKIHHALSLISGNLFGGMYFSTKRIISEIKKINPDVVNLHCLNGYFVNIYKLLKWLAKNKIKTVLTMHADFMMTGGCGYAVDCKKYLTSDCKKCEFIKEFNGKMSLNRAHKNYLGFKKSISKFDKSLIRITTVSPWLTERYLESPIYKGIHIETILNPVDNIFFDDDKNNPYKEKNNVLYVTPDIYDPVKSGFLLFEIAKQCPNINFTIICGKNVDIKENLKNVTYIKGGVSKNSLKDYYYFADATLVLSKRETFSMIVAESLACGTQVIGFKSGGPESICLDKYCSFVEYANIEAIVKALKPSIFSKEQIILEAKEKYNVNSIAKRYLSMYNFAK